MKRNGYRTFAGDAGVGDDDDTETRQPTLAGLQSESTSSCCGSLFRRLFALRGWLYTAATLPCGLCGGGPVVRIQQGYRGALLRFGRLVEELEPGLHHYNAGSEEIVVMDVRERTLDVAKQEIVTADNLQVLVNAVVIYSVNDVVRALFDVREVHHACGDLAQCRLRAAVSESTLDELFHNRDAVNARIAQQLAQETRDWGLNVRSVEIKDIAISEGLQRVMASATEAEREGRGKIIAAEAERTAASILADAAALLGDNPNAMEIRRLQTWREIASEGKAHTIIIGSPAVPPAMGQSAAVASALVAPMSADSAGPSGS